MTSIFLLSCQNVPPDLVLPIGSQPFGALNILTRPPVLIPRPETEHWVVRLSHLSLPARTTRRLLDLGTGSGCIPLLLCHLWRSGSIIKATGVDISDDALQLANDNAILCGVAPPRDTNHNRNTFVAIKANFLDPIFYQNPSLGLPVDVLTSNPPYITWGEYINLPHSVSAFEDPKALFGGPSGMEFYHAIARFVAREDTLSPGAIVALEVGHRQAKAVQALLQNTSNIKRTEIWNDPWGKERTVVGFA